MIVIGSKALEYHHPELLDREPADLDLIGSEAEFYQLLDQLHQFTPIWGVYPIAQGRKYLIRSEWEKPIEFEIRWPGSTADRFATLMETFCSQAIETMHLVPETFLENCWVPNLDVLFAVKTTHRFAPTKNFHKTRLDWLNMRAYGAEVPPMLQHWVDLRTKETLQKKHPKLNVTKAQFFNPDEVDYVYDHDSIHRAVAYESKPAYTFFQEPGAEVKCSRELFEKTILLRRLHSVAEEAYVLSIERSHVPHGRLTPRQAFDIAIQRVCTNISSGWWRDFAYENLDHVVSVYRDDYLERFNAALTAGKIPPFQGSKYGPNKTGKPSSAQAR